MHHCLATALLRFLNSLCFSEFFRHVVHQKGIGWYNRSWWSGPASLLNWQHGRIVWLFNNNFPLHLLGVKQVSKDLRMSPSRVFQMMSYSLQPTKIIGCGVRVHVCPVPSGRSRRSRVGASMCVLSVYTAMQWRIYAALCKAKWEQKTDTLKLQL